MIQTKFFKQAAVASVMALFALPVFAAEEPETPTNITVTNRKALSATINWDPVEIAVSYTVELSNANGGQIAIVYDITETSITFGENKLTSNKEYFVRIRAVDEDDDLSALSDPVYFRTKPAKVKNLIILESDNVSARLQWDKPRGTINHYLIQVWHAGEVIRTIKKTTGLTKEQPRKLIENLNPAWGYGFRVRAVYDADNKGKYSDKIHLDPRQ